MIILKTTNEYREVNKMFNYILTSSGELYHYGVKGMRWGVRKTRLYTSTNDHVGENYTDRQRKRMKKQARSILKGKIKESDSVAKFYERDAAMAYKKVDRLTSKSEKRQVKGDQEGFNKYQSKAWKQVARHITSTQKAEAQRSISRSANKRLSEISNDTLKAGKDYVTNITSSTNLLLSAGGIINWRTERRIDYAKK